MSNPILSQAQVRGEAPIGKVRAERFTGSFSQAKRKRLAEMLPRPPLQRAVEIEQRTIIVHVRTINPLNNKECWQAQAKRAKKERDLTYVFLSRARPLPELPWDVTLFRIGSNKRAMDETEGLRASMKHIADEIAACAGRDDNDKAAFSWHYDQRYMAKTNVVQVTIRTRQPATAEGKAI